MHLGLFSEAARCYRTELTGRRLSSRKGHEAQARVSGQGPRLGSFSVFADAAPASGPTHPHQEREREAHPRIRVSAPAEPNTLGLYVTL